MNTKHRTRQNTSTAAKPRTESNTTNSQRPCPRAREHSVEQPHRTEKPARGSLPSQHPLDNEPDHSPSSIDTARGSEARPTKQLSQLYRLLKEESVKSAIAELSKSLLGGLYSGRGAVCVVGLCVGLVLVQSLFSGGSLDQLLFKGLGSLVQPLFRGEETSVRLFMHKVGFWLSFIVVGFIQRDDVDGLRWLLLARVSTNAQLDGVSIEAQIDYLKTEVKKASGKIIEVIQETESAASMERESLEKIVELAENDEFDVLGVWKLDRLTRADPLESMAYLHRLKEAGVTLYSDTHRYFDWNDPHDMNVLYQQVVFSHQWYNRVEENTSEGSIRALKNGEWPNPEAIFGYEKDENDKVRLTDRGKEIIPEIFELYLETENLKETYRRINDRYDFGNGSELSYGRVGRVLEGRLCIGQFTHRGEVVYEDPELAVIDKDVFNRVQEVLEENSRSQTDVSDIPDWLNRATQRFGPDYVCSQIDGFSLQCPKCGGELRDEGEEDVKREKVKEYKCTSDDCKFAGCLLKEDVIDEFHDALPMQCPLCPSVETFKIEEVDDGPKDYHYQCRACGLSLLMDVKPDKYERGMQYPDCKFDINRPVHVEATKRDSENQNQGQSNSTAPDSSSDAETSSRSEDEEGKESLQKSLSSF